MATKTVQDSSLTAVADAIRAKTGKSASMEFPDEFVSEIGSISGSGEPEVKEVTFFDYDGTVLYSYTPEEFLALTEMPATVSDSEMVSQGWNWTLAGAKTWVQKYGMLSIGQTRVPADGSTRIIINAQAGRTFTFKMSGTYSGTVDWGDGSTPGTLTGTNSHVYVTDGQYTIRIHTATGNHYSPYMSVGGYMVEEMNFGAQATDNIGINFGGMDSIRIFSLPKGLNTISINFLIRATLLQAIIYPDTITSLTYADVTYYCNAISYPEGFISPRGVSFDKAEIVTLPISAAGYLNFAFSKCKYLVISDDMTGDVPSNRLRNMPYTEKLYLSKNITGFGGYSFNGFLKLKELSVPLNVTTINASTFTSLHSLESLTLPERLQTIGNSSFSEIRKLKIVVIPSTVTSIGSGCFTQANSLKEVHLLPTTPPTLGATSCFGDNPSDCIFYVPQGSLSAYQSATNWSTYASKMQEEPS